jgi:hypothetical protein
MMVLVRWILRSEFISSARIDMEHMIANIRASCMPKQIVDKILGR